MEAMQMHTKITAAFSQPLAAQIWQAKYRYATVKAQLTVAGRHLKWVAMVAPMKPHLTR
jgi:hypothetical protein